MILSLDGLVRNCFLLETGLLDCVKTPAFTAHFEQGQGISPALISD